ncbi:xanthine dehydrogenase family protein subunit M [Saccharomonospora xinjiangensis]|uniref:FAD binding domain-containing protein n=1 Tax=Saccharomonospora xinjiangensis TaxID=75294 RepID=UPI001070371A|nr:xanthine dehydrogenase family protein subunit M [Saccharomonospora xinjiangensis]QBQ60445.1 Carbon monoxide dehydrogenase medium chain [Saccharomonospora xinjiangensis]
MIPATLRYHRASSVDDALSMLADHGDEAALLAGGHSLLPLMKLRLAAPDVVVDIGGLPELSYVRLDGDTVAIGATTRYHDLMRHPVLTEHAPLVAHVAGVIGDPQVRHRGTIGGAVAHADPAADLPAALLACDAEFVVRGPEGERTIAAGGFFLGPFTTAREPGELLTEIRLPRADGRGWGFEKFTRRAIDWAIVGVAVQGNQVGLINMAGTPRRASATERALAEGASIAEAAALAAEDTNPADEPHATAEYRAHLARVLTERALLRASGNG